MSVIQFLIGFALGAFVWWDVRQQRKIIMAKLSSLAASLTALGDQTAKIIAEIQTLKGTLTDVDLPADAEASLARLTGLIQSADDENADAPPVEPPVDPPV